MKKLNALLILILLAVLGLAGFLGYTYIQGNRKVIVPDFLGRDINEAIEWCGALDEKYACEFVYEESTSIDKDKIFNQSVSAENELTDKITFTVSSELIKEIAFPAISDTTRKSDIEIWAAENGILNISFTEEESDSKPDGSIIRIEPAQGIYKNTPVTVYIARSKEVKPDSDGKIEVKSGTYTNLSVSEFETKVKALGLVPNHLESKDAKSDSVTKGNIVWHGSGTYEKGEKINYGVCTEKTDGIVVSSGTYVGKTEEDFKKAATDLGLKPNHKTEKDAYSTTVEKGKIVWHGSGTYVKDETFNYGLSLGKEDGTVTEEDLNISRGKYVGKTEEEFKKIATDLGLKPVHLTERDAYSDTVAKGSIVTHGNGQYEKGENFNYGLSLGKEDGTSADDLYVSKDKYVGKTEEEFKKIATNLGLKPVHLSDRDAYSDTVTKGSIVTHGYGQYEKDEDFNYGLSLGKKDSSSTSTDEDFYISKDKYVGKTESEFKKIATDLGLNPVHLSDRDAYSDSVAKGSIVTHGYGWYENKENFNYGLSLGKKESTPATTKVTVDSGYTGKTESEFKSYISGLGLKLSKTGEDYSDSVASGCILSYKAGEYDSGDTVSYTVSLGKKVTEATVMRPQYYQAGETFNATKITIAEALSAFTNVQFVEATSSHGEAVGQILKITVNGNESYTGGTYSTDTPIVVYIVAKQGN